MDKQKYLNILKNDIERFISNYLIDGNLDELDDADKVNLYITDSFPYLSILHLIHSNFDSKEADNFTKKHVSVLADETKQLKLLLGYFLCDNTELEQLKHRLALSLKENEEKATEIHLLNEELTNIKNQKQALEKGKEILNQEIKKLVKKIAELESGRNKTVSNPTNGPNPKDLDNENTTEIIPSDLIDMGTSVLWRSSNLGAEKGFEEGDYFSWGALNSAEYFGSDVWGYKQVIKKNISGIHEFDAAQSILGEGYRIPTVKEWEELMRVCDFKSRTVSIKGRKYAKLVSSITNKQLLLPIIGHIEADMCQNEYAQYWTAEQSTGKSAHICQIHENNLDMTYAPKWCGFPIRPVFDKSNKPLVLDDNDRMRIQIEDSNKRIHVSVQNVISSLFPSRNTSSIISKKYPAKSDINESNIFNMLIKECLPYGKHVFEGDIISNVNLDLKKLNTILKDNYSVGPLIYDNIKHMRIKDLKSLILMKLQY